MIPKLTNKIFIEGTIKCLTGLRIGGNKSSLEIGGVDLSIIKSADGLPYIPGSSIKGKMRSLLAKLQGWENADQDKEQITDLFGSGGGKDKDSKVITRLFVRDASLDKKEFEISFPDRTKRDFEYSETKTENVIDRSTGKAQHPRTIERVPAGSVFTFSMVIDVYEGDNYNNYLRTMQSALELLQYDYLGGHGSRGSGKVKITVTAVEGKEFKDGVVLPMLADTWPEFIQKVNDAVKEPA